MLKMVTLAWNSPLMKGLKELQICDEFNYFRQIYDNCSPQKHLKGD